MPLDFSESSRFLSSCLPYFLAMDKRLGSVKSIMDGVCDRYYRGETAAAKAPKESEKPEPQKTVTISDKGSESSNKEAKKEKSMGKPTSSAESLPASVASLPKRSVKKGKRVLRKIGDQKTLPSEEVACSTPSKEVAFREPLKTVNEMTMKEGEKGNPANLFSLNISEEVASFNKIFPPDAITSPLSEKKVSSRSSSHSSGEMPLKKRKIEADSLTVDNVEVVVSKEVAASVVDEEHQSPIADEEHQSPIADVGDCHQEVLTTNVIILDKSPEDVAAGDIQTAISLETKEPPADVKAELIEESVDCSLQPVNNFPPTDPIIIPDENPAAAEKQEISYEEFQTFRSETARLREEVIRLRGDLVDVNKELSNVNRELSNVNRELEKIKVKAKVKASGGSKSEDIVNGALCLLQKFVRKGLISPEEAMDPSLWD